MAISAIVAYDTCMYVYVGLYIQHSQKRERYSAPKEFLAGLRGRTAAALVIDKVGPRLYHFRSGPTSGPSTRPGSKKSKISVVHRLVVLGV